MAMQVANRPRLLLTCSVLGALAASSTTALLLPTHDREPEVVAMPSFPQAQQSSAPLTVGEPVTGKQIVDLAAGPAVDRARQLAAQAKPTVAPSADPAPDDVEQLRVRIKQACEDGDLKGKICRNR